MNEIVFQVQDTPGGGFTAWAAEYDIMIQADNFQDMKANLLAAIQTHFGKDQIPELIRLSSNKSDRVLKIVHDETCGMALETIAWHHKKMPRQFQWEIVLLAAIAGLIAALGVILAEYLAFQGISSHWAWLTKGEWVFVIPSLIGGLFSGFIIGRLCASRFSTVMILALLSAPGGWLGFVVFFLMVPRLEFVAPSILSSCAGSATGAELGMAIRNFAANAKRLHDEKKMSLESNHE